jgi:hypothetical protein
MAFTSAAGSLIWGYDVNSNSSASPPASPPPQANLYVKHIQKCEYGEQCVQLQSNYQADKLVDW